MRLLHQWINAVVLGVAAAIASPAIAQVYKWVDENGVTHYGQRPAHGPSSQPKRLDIRVTGNDPAPLPGAICYTIQCQYERMRDDRLIRDEEWRKDTETRTRLIAAQNEAKARDAATAAGPVITRVPVIVGRRIPPYLQRPHGGHAVPGPQGPVPPRQPAEPQVSIGRR
jgi:hypothetical protein